VPNEDVTGSRVMGNCLCFFPPLGQAVWSGGKGQGDGQSDLHPGEDGTYPKKYYLFTASEVVLPPATGNARMTVTTGPLEVANTILPAFYRVTRREPGAGTVDETQDTPDYLTRTVQFTNLLLGHPYEFRAQLRSTTAAIGAEHTQIITFQGQDPDPEPEPPGDTTPPSVTIVYPAALQVVSGIITFQVTVADASGILRVEHRVNGTLLPGPQFDTRTLPNGNATYSCFAEDNAVAHNQTTVSRVFTITNPAIPPVDPPEEPDPPLAVFLDAVGEFTVAYVLWVNTPVGFENRFKQKFSRWPLATDEEVALIEAGRVAEKYGYLDRIGTDADMQAALLVEWQRWNTEVQSVTAWGLENAVWDGTAWNTRG
jgi:hypothetical protein